VAEDAAGDFVVSYTINNGLSNDIMATLYRTGLSPKAISVATTAKNETSSSVAMTPDGRFDIAYQYQYSATDNDIYLARYSSTGVFQGNTTVAGSSANTTAPSVSVDSSGAAVVAYRKQTAGDDFIEAVRVSSSGVPGGEIQTASYSVALAPSVALNPTGGAFVLAYVTEPTPSGEFAIPTVFATAVGGNNKLGPTYNAGIPRYGPAISVDASGDFLLTDATGNGAPNSANARYLVVP
jgi:hypothetical protein